MQQCISTHLIKEERYYSIIIHNLYVTDSRQYNEIKAKDTQSYTVVLNPEVNLYIPFIALKIDNF